VTFALGTRRHGRLNLVDHLRKDRFDSGRLVNDVHVQLGIVLPL
jgi:hypothetical protein